MTDKKTSISRLAKPEKEEFTVVNEHFSGKRNEESDVFLQALTNDDRPVVLVVEDNKDLREYISRSVNFRFENSGSLSTNFRVSSSELQT